MTTLTAPQRGGRREEAQRLLTGLPEGLHGKTVEILFSPGASASPSFVDEIISIVLVEREARRLQLVGLGEDLSRLAHSSAESLGVVDRLRCNP